MKPEKYPGGALSFAIAARGGKHRFARVQTTVTLANGSVCQRCDDTIAPFSALFSIDTHIPAKGERCNVSWPLCVECGLGILADRGVILAAEAQDETNIPVDEWLENFGRTEREADARATDSTRPALDSPHVYDGPVLVVPAKTPCPVEGCPDSSHPHIHARSEPPPETQRSGEKR